MTLFERIIAREIPGDIVYEDADCVAIRDIHPVAPTHLLVIPRRPIPRLSQAAPEDHALLGRLLAAVPVVARAAGLASFRVVINDGAEAGQSVFHLHLHVIGGRSLGWPPG